MSEPVSFEIATDFEYSDQLQVEIVVKAIDGNKYITTVFYMTKKQFEKFVEEGTEYFEGEEE